MVRICTPTKTGHAQATRKNSSDARCVAVLVETTLRFWQKILIGIARFAQTQQHHWDVPQQPWDLGLTSLEYFSRWHGDGIIARIEGSQMVQLIRSLQVSTVDLLGQHPMCGVPIIHMDHRNVVRLALDHLQAQGVKQFAYCGYVGSQFSDEREHHFRKLVQKLGRIPYVVEGAVSRRGRSVRTSTLYGRELLHQDALIEWIAGLPRPIGVLCSNDIRGSQVLRACRTLGVDVPGEVAVIGIDNDEFICELCDPPLSSVDPNAEGIGFESAALLARLMEGRRAPARKTLVPPLCVVPRQSTRVLRLADPEIAQAVRFIREHPCESIAVKDVLAHVPMSRRSLERGFRRLLGTSPHAEILRVRLERVKELLVSTDETLSRIAELTGFEHAEYMSHLFREKVGFTPGEYRKRFSK
jgi:LacI family transcriptional regulator